MMWMSLVRRLLLASSSMTCASCFISTGDDSVSLVSTGRLTLHWTIDGTDHPAQCSQRGAANARISVHSGAALVSEYVQGCTVFGTTIQLNPGDYSARVHLEDSAGRPRTTDVELYPFRIISGTNLDVPVDFPASSFY